MVSFYRNVFSKPANDVTVRKNTWDMGKLCIYIQFIVISKLQIANCNDRLLILNMSNLHTFEFLKEKLSCWFEY